ncbi:MAG TPA: hypothetical protein VF534_27595 [Paraburkholderia sp.]
MAFGEILYGLKVCTGDLNDDAHGSEFIGQFIFEYRIYRLALHLGVVPYTGFVKFLLQRTRFFKIAEILIGSDTELP